MADTIAKELQNFKVSFKILPNEKKALISHQFVLCHIIFDIKMENFRFKARLVAGGHMTKLPATITYTSVVSRETVRIALVIATLNDLEVVLGDILSAYTQAPDTEKV